MMMDMGEKIQEIAPTVAEKQENKVRYPSLFIDRELPLSDKDIGKTMMMMCKLKLRSISKRADKSGKNENYSFDVMGMDMNPKMSHYNK